MQGVKRVIMRYELHIVNFQIVYWGLKHNIYIENIMLNVLMEKILIKKEVLRIVIVRKKTGNVILDLVGKVMEFVT